MNEIWNFSLFTIQNRNFTFGEIALTVITLAVAYTIYRKVLRVYFPRIFTYTHTDNNEFKNVKSTFRLLTLLGITLATVIILDLNFSLHQNEGWNISIVLILKALIFYQVAKLVDWFISTILVYNYTKNRENSTYDVEKHPRDNQDTGTVARGMVQHVFYVVVGLFILRNFNMDFTLYERVLNGETLYLKISNILSAILVLLSARLLVWVITQLFLYRLYANKKVDLGAKYSINQLIKYVIYVIAIIISLGHFGININILLGGAAALLVGIGLGLQQTFNDIISGLVLLFERSVSVGDILEVDGVRGLIKEIGLRTSTLETLDGITMVIPNHKLVNEKVINWNHYGDRVRFQINIGVAYGSDTQLVKKILLKAVMSNPYLIKSPAPTVEFEGFGESALDFRLLFFTRNLFVIDQIKSDIRFEVDRLFKENDIEIPFPQQTIHLGGNFPKGILKEKP